MIWVSSDTCTRGVRRHSNTQKKSTMSRDPRLFNSGRLRGGVVRAMEGYKTTREICAGAAHRHLGRPRKQADGLLKNDEGQLPLPSRMSVACRVAIVMTSVLNVHPFPSTPSSCRYHFHIACLGSPKARDVRLIPSPSFLPWVSRGTHVLSVHLRLLMLSGFPEHHRVLHLRQTKQTLTRLKKVVEQEFRVFGPAGLG